ncbi:hypothetical protein BGX38DRAFT_1209412 [Terfezia claveryi]|nr:hypothetical protein BGX38DRAFT_1209412 [Terfezia claveryi]
MRWDAARWVGLSLIALALVWACICICPFLGWWGPKEGISMCVHTYSFTSCNIFLINSLVLR